MLSVIIGKLYTSSRGTILVGSIIGNYSLTLSCLEKSYDVNFGSPPEENVNVTVALPSGHMTIISCVFGGGICFNETNPSEASMITNTTTVSASDTPFISLSKPMGMSLRVLSDQPSTPVERVTHT